MTTARARRPGGWPPASEVVLSAAVLAGFTLTVMFFLARSYLPSPFFYDNFDTFMDWHSTAYWSAQPGTYEVWRSIYPPLSSVLVNLVSDSSCHTDPFASRDCDMPSKLAIAVLFLTTVALVVRCLWLTDRRTALPRGVAFAFGLPLLYTLERGNLLLATMPCLALAYGPQRIGGVARSFWLAMACNFKPNLLPIVASFAIKRRWRILEITGLMAVAVYAVCYAILGRGSPFEVLKNISDFFVNTRAVVIERLYFMTGFGPLTLFDEYHFPIRDYLGSVIVEAINFWVPVLTNSAVIVGLLAIVAAWLQPHVVSNARIAAIIQAEYLFFSSPGTYYILILVFFVFLEKWQRPGPICALVCAYVVSIPHDMVLADLVVRPETAIWLSGAQTQTSIGMTLGMFLRPAAVLVIIWALSLDTISQSIRAHRTTKPLIGLGTPAMAWVGMGRGAPA